MANSGLGTILKSMFALLALLVVTIGLMIVLRLADFRQRVENLKAEGAPVSFVDLQFEVADAEQDCLTYVLKANPLLDKFRTRIIEIDPILTIAYASPVLDEEKVALVNALLEEELPELLTLIEQASNCQDISLRNSPLLNGSIKGGPENFMFAVLSIDQMAEVLQARGRCLIFEQRIEEAIECGLQAMRLAQIASRRAEGVASVMYIWGTSFRGMRLIYDILSSQQIDEAWHQKINDELDAYDAFEAGYTAIRSERASIIEHLAHQGIQHVAINGIGSLKHLQEIASVTRKDFHEYPRVEVEFSRWRDGPFTEAIGPAWTEMFPDLQAAQISRLRALRIINALTSNNVTAAEWDAARNQRELLMSLGVPESMTVDTVTGELMTVRWQDGRWFVYSVGFDGQDDGTRPDDYGFGWMPEVYADE